MTPETVARYQPPNGNIFLRLKEQYGAGAALNIANAAATGSDTDVSAAITAARYGPRLDDSTAGNFFNQIFTDPLAAPIETVNAQVGNAVKSLFGNPWTLLVTALAVFLVFKRVTR